MSNITLTDKMNETIKDLLRRSKEPFNLYILARIEQLEAENAAFRAPSDHIVAANKKVDDNPPLTLEELREMGGEPVWIEDWWQDFHGWEFSADAQDYCAERDANQYGTLWLAYRHKPEETVTNRNDLRHKPEED